MPSAATFSWLGAYPGGYTNAANWSSQDADHTVPVNGDDLYFGLAPVIGDPVLVGSPTPPSSPPPSNNCTIPYGSMFSSFTGVHILSGYTATVTFQNATTVGDFDLQNGAVEQASAGSELTITHYLSFLGGTLNSGTALSTVHIAGKDGVGASAAFQPLYTPTLTIGSTISVEGLGGETTGAGLGMYSGLYKYSNSADTNVLEYCFAQLGKEGPPKPDGTIEGKGIITQAIGAGKGYTRVFIGTKGSASTKGYTGVANIEVQGSFSIEAKSVVSLTTPVGNYSLKCSITENIRAGSISIYGGAQLTLEKGFDIAGSCTIFPVAALNEQPENRTVFIDGTVTLESSGFLSMRKQVGLFPALSVTKDVTIGGTCEFDVDGATAQSIGCSYLQSSKTIDFTQTAKLDMLVPEVIRMGQAWSIMLASDGITGTLPNSGGYNSVLSPNGKILQVVKS